MVMDFLGQNLEELMKEVGTKLTLLTTLYVAEQMVRFCTKSDYLISSAE
jgi:hypothetical protein